MPNCTGIFPIRQHSLSLQFGSNDNHISPGISSSPVQPLAFKSTLPHICWSVIIPFRYLTNFFYLRHVSFDAGSASWLPCGSTMPTGSKRQWWRMAITRGKITLSECYRLICKLTLSQLTPNEFITEWRPTPLASWLRKKGIRGWFTQLHALFDRYIKHTVLMLSLSHYVHQFLKTVTEV